MSTEISTQTQPRGLALSTMDEAFRFSQMVAKSDFAPKDFRGKPESCLLAIQHGAEIGLSPMQSLQSIAVINGKPSVYGDTALAVCRGSSVCEYVRERIDGDGESMTAICEAKRRGDPEPVVARFSVADAKKASLWGKTGPWTQYSRRMLQMRARGFALRDCFPDVLAGLITAEEARDYPTPAAPPMPEPAEETYSQVPTADAAAMSKARQAINAANDPQRVREYALAIQERQDAGFYTDEQASELLDLADGRHDLLTAEVEEVQA